MPLRLVLAWLAVLALVVPALAEPPTLAKLAGPSAGSAAHGWFVLAAPSDRATLYHVPRDSAPGSIRLARMLARMPDEMAAQGAELVMVFAPESREGARAPVRAVRRITAQPLRPGWSVYSEPLPAAPLPGDGVLVGFHGSEDGVLALLRGDEPGAQRGVGTLLRLRRGEWQPLNLPVGLSPASAWSLAAVGASPVIVERGAAARVWLGVADDDGSVRWTPREVTLATSAVVIELDGQLVTLDRTLDGEVVLSIVRGEHVLPRGRVAGVPSSAIAAPVGDRLTFVWEPGAASLRLLTKVVTVDGAVLHEGAAIAGSPVSSGEVQVLALLLGSLVVTIVLFLVKPERGGREPVLPAGTSLAEPSRRLLAASIDVLPGLLLAGTIWGQVGVASEREAAAAGIWPLILVGAVTVLHMGFAEWRWGRTLGKAMLGCRTVRVDGGRPTAWQAWGRSIAKVMCPGVIVWVVLAPYAVHFWSLGTLVVLETEPRKPEEPGGMNDADGGGPERPS